MSRRRRTHSFLSRIYLARDLTVITLAIAVVTAVIGMSGLFDAVDSWLVALRFNLFTRDYQPDPNLTPTSPFGDVCMLEFDQDDLKVAGWDAAKQGRDGVLQWHHREQMQWMVRRSLEIFADLREANPIYAPAVIGLDFYNLGAPDNPRVPDMAEALNAAAARLGNIVDGYRQFEPGEVEVSSRTFVLQDAAAHGYLDLVRPSDRWMTAHTTRRVTIGLVEGEHVRECFALAVSRLMIEARGEEPGWHPDRLEIPSAGEISERTLPPRVFLREREGGERRLQIHPLFLPPRQSVSTEEGLAPARSAFPVLHFRDLIELHQMMESGQGPDFWPGLSAIYGRALLIGVDMPELDRIQTPYTNRLFGSHEYPGVEVHGQIVYNLLNGTALAPLDWSRPILAWLILLVLMYGSAWCAGRLSLILSILAALGTLALVLLLDVWLWRAHGIWLPLTQWFTGVAMANRSAAQLLARREHRARALVTQRLEQHVTQQVAKQLIHNPAMAELGGEKREVTVLFSDLQGFTTLTERLPPDVMMGLMNRYLHAMGREIAEEGGTLANYVGDAIFAIFGAPEHLDDHAAHGARAAIRMQQALARFNREIVAESFEPLFQRIGLSTGEVVCGNVGGTDRFLWTAMGDAVPIGARLEPMNKKYGTAILLPTATRERLGPEFKVIPVDQQVPIRGRVGKLDIFTLEVPEVPLPSQDGACGQPAGE
ncbi:CHASE2 domain-containing protein [Candidatus Sumerlaeota bacterium]|nr:CHASE2 domain-containing protein [Candidatus Sumerlaeota bacterium]